MAVSFVLAARGAGKLNGKMKNPFYNGNSTRRSCFDYAIFYIYTHACTRARTHVA